MSRGNLIRTVWWDTKLSNGKTPAEVVSAVGKDLGFTKNDEKQILTRLLVLKDKKLFSGIGAVSEILICTFLCANMWLLGKDPVSPRKFEKICRKHKFNISYSSLMKWVRVAKNKGDFKSGHTSKKILERYENRIKFKFHLSKKFLDEIKWFISNDRGNVATGSSPFTVVASVIYYHPKMGELTPTQEELAEFFGTTQMSIRNFREKYFEMSCNIGMTKS